MADLHRSRRHRLVAGVAGGLAETFHLPVWLVRLLFFLALLPGGVPGLVPYILLWIFLPVRDEVPRGPAVRPHGSGRTVSRG